MNEPLYYYLNYLALIKTIEIWNEQRIRSISPSPGLQPVVLQVPDIQAQDRIAKKLDSICIHTKFC